MSAYRDSLPEHMLARYDEAFTAAARILGRARSERDSMSPREAAEAAYTPGGPSVEELEELIISHRAEARRAMAARQNKDAA